MTDFEGNPKGVAQMNDLDFSVANSLATLFFMGITWWVGRLTGYARGHEDGTRQGRIQGYSRGIAANHAHK